MAEQVFERRHQKSGIVLKCAETKVALLAQQPANLATSMVMIDMQRITAPIFSLGHLAANRAFAVLLLIHTIKFFYANTVRPSKLVRFVRSALSGHGKLSDSIHVLHGYIARWPRWTTEHFGRAFRASSAVLLHFRPVKQRIAPFTWLEYPAPRSEFWLSWCPRFSIGEPSIGQLARTDTARMLFVINQSCPLAKIGCVTRFLAARAHSLAWIQCRKFMAFVTKVTVKISARDKGSAPVARDNPVTGMSYQLVLFSFGLRVFHIGVVYGID